MNHLAHFYLASIHPDIPLADSLTGAFLGDHVKGRLRQHYPDNIEKGIRLHRRIDAFTDQHPSVSISYQRFQAPIRRFAPIIVDLVFDHLLARDWERHHSETLGDFCSQVFKELAPLIPLFPDLARRQIRVMEERQSMQQYADTRFISRSLQYLSGRIRRENPLADAFEIVVNELPGLEQDFEIFFPQIREFVKQPHSLAV